MDLLWTEWLGVPHVETSASDLGLQKAFNPEPAFSRHSPSSQLCLCAYQAKGMAAHLSASLPQGQNLPTLSLSVYR